MKLYILNIPNEKAIKIGVSKNYKSRIKDLKKVYDIDLNSSYIINSNSKLLIETLEKQILSDYYEFSVKDSKFNGHDGHTELRNISILNDVLNDIKYKSNKFKNKNIEITKGIDLTQENKKQNDKRLNLRVDLVLYEKIESKLNKENINVSDYVRGLIERDLD